MARTPVLVRRALLVVVLALPLGACASKPRDPNAAPSPLEMRTTLRVENHRLEDQVIYVVQGGLRQRIGQASGKGTTTLVIPPGIVGAGAQLRFLAAPISGARNEYGQSIYVSPGDEVEIVIQGT